MIEVLNKNEYMQNVFKPLKIILTPTAKNNFVRKI